MSVAKIEEPRDLFKTFASLFIALITVTGAIVAWRISTATGKASGADSEGLAAALASANASTNISTYLNSQLGFFTDYRAHFEMAKLLEQDAASAADPERKAAYNDQAVRERNLAATSMTQIDPEYVRTDRSSGKQIFDTERYRATQLAEAKARQNLEYDSLFRTADGKRNKARGLVGVTILFSAALFLLTASTNTRRRIKYLLAVGAVPLFFGGLVIVVALEILW